MVLKPALEQTIAKWGGSPAVLHREHILSYDELAEAEAVVRQRLGIFPGARVVVLLPDSIPCYIVYYSLFVRKAIAIPVSVRGTAHQIRDVVARTSPHLVITNRFLHRKHSGILRHTRAVIVEPNSVGTAQATLHEIPADGLEGRRGLEPPQDEGIRLLVFTSGTTGASKGVCLSEENLVAAARMMIDFLGLTPQRRSLVTVPAYDYYGYINILGHILSGAQCVYGESATLVAGLLKRIVELEVTDLVAVPHSLRQIVEAAKTAAPAALAGLGTVTSSSDVLTDDILDALFGLNHGVRLFNIYGLTEAGRACFREIRADSPRSRSIGKPSRGVSITLEGTKGQPEEIVIQGPNVTIGYLEAISGNQVKLRSVREMRTGDLGYVDENGEIVLLGRRDHLININGEKIHPVEIESAVQGLPRVRDAIARPVLGVDGSTTIRLDVVCDDLERHRDLITRQLHDRLPRAFVPTEIRSIDAVPRTELGAKLIRGEELG